MDPGLAEETERPALGVRIHQFPHLLRPEPTLSRNPSDLDFGGGRADVGIEAAA